jgi:hypothetical protein
MSDLSIDTKKTYHEISWDYPFKSDYNCANQLWRTKSLYHGRHISLSEMLCDAVKLWML